MWLRSRLLWLCLCCAWLIALGGAGVALADVSPSQQMPGSGISPGGSTQVRMIAEQIMLDVQPIPSDQLTSDKAPMQAQVRGRFTMRNLGDADEHMQVLFPRSNPRGRDDGFGRYPKVLQFAVQVGGLPLSTTVITSTNPQNANPQNAEQPPIEWLAFPVDFPVGQDVLIDVSYTIVPTQYSNDPFGSFAYVLQTGAGWRDSIGSAEITVQLPYKATTENVRGRSPFNIHDITPGATFDGNQVRWSFQNLEPTEQDDIFITVMVPGIWQGIADARAAVAKDPADALALGGLALAYEAAVQYHGVNINPTDPFIALGEQTYEQAIKLDPGSAQLHADYAALIWKHNETPAMLDHVNDPKVLSAVQHALTEISLALSIDPQQKSALATFADMQSMSQKPLVLPKVTPAPSATLAPTDIPQPTATPAPAPTNTPAPGPGAATGSGWLLLGGGVLIGLALAGVAYALIVRRQ